ncbi:MAG: hypothetical protein ABR599_09835 [Gemmatimonadota bacterium]
MSDPAVSMADSAAGGRSYAGFSPEAFATEPLALLPPSAISLPADLEGGPQGDALRRELTIVVTERLPEELRILHSRAPVFGYADWAGREEAGPRAGFLQSVLGWTGSPGPAGELPPMVGNSVEELGDSRGIRYFLFPRVLRVTRSETFGYDATLEAYLLDARGERVVWAGVGRAVGELPEDVQTERLLQDVVLDAARGAAADLSARLPGSASAGGRSGFTDVEAGAGVEGR